MQLAFPMAAAGDREGAAVPLGLEVFDAHVHLFPPGVFEALWRWFDRHLWPIRYRLHAEEVVDFLSARGVRRIAALHYAHKPGMATLLNRFVAEVAAAHPEVVPFGTVFPGEPDARAIVREALSHLGLRGIKLHCHVQKLGADDARLDEIYEECAAAGRPVVIHAGREPAHPAYGVDAHALCAAAQIDRVLQRHPTLRLVVPHLGLDEIDEYLALLSRHEHLHLDTTMAIGGYFPVDLAPQLLSRHADRLLYGSDFPNLPYAWDRELKVIAAAGLDEVAQRNILHDNAARLFD